MPRSSKTRGVRGSMNAPKAYSGSNLVADTIKGIPAAAKRLGKDASQMFSEGVLQTYAPATGAYKNVRSAASDMAKAFRGKPSTENIKGYKKGGKVKKTGPALVHKGERVLRKTQAQKFEKMKRKVFGIKNYGKNK